MHLSVTAQWSTIDRVSQNLSFTHVTTPLAGLSDPGVLGHRLESRCLWGIPWHPQILADQLVLSQPGQLLLQDFRPSYGPVAVLSLRGVDDPFGSKHGLTILTHKSYATAPSHEDEWLY